MGPNRDREKTLLEKGYLEIAGLDEAGRGAWAGPVVAACLKFGFKNKKRGLPGINDSKLLTARCREKIFSWLADNFDFGVGVVANELIDALGIVQATKLAMEQAIGQLENPPDYLLIDALKLENNIKQDNLIKGDSRIWSIAAASIIAKVTRDRIMDRGHEKYPAYGFNRHKGYGTREHWENIKKIGVCPLHRLSYRPISTLNRGF